MQTVSERTGERNAKICMTKVFAKIGADCCRDSPEILLLLEPANNRKGTNSFSTTISTTDCDKTLDHDRDHDRQRH